MLTQNFNQVACAQIISASPYPTFKTKTGQVLSKTSQTGTFALVSLFAPNSLPSADVDYSKATFCFGTGESTSTKDMYNLESEIASYSGFTLNSNSKSITAGMGGKVLLTQTLSYSGEPDITIKEVGYFQGITFPNSVKEWVMFAREVLDSPITVHNGDTFTVSMAIG